MSSVEPSPTQEPVGIAQPLTPEELADTDEDGKCYRCDSRGRCTYACEMRP